MDNIPMYNFNCVLTETSTKCWFKSPYAGTGADPRMVRIGTGPPF